MSGLSGSRSLSSPPPLPPAPTFFAPFCPMPSRAYPAWLEGNGNDCYAGYFAFQTMTSVIPVQRSTDCMKFCRLHKMRIQLRWPLTLCGLSLLLLVLVSAPGDFLRVLRFSSLHKNQHFQIPIRPGNSGEKSRATTCTPLQFLFIIYFIIKVKTWI